MEDKKRAFGFKLDAVKYHLDKMGFIFNNNKSHFLNITKNSKLPASEEIRPFFFYYDAFLFELVSCFDIILDMNPKICTTT